MQASTLLDMSETEPGFYVANLTTSERLPARRRPSMVLRYEACGGLFNQVRRAALPAHRLSVTLTVTLTPTHYPMDPAPAVYPSLVPKQCSLLGHIA